MPRPLRPARSAAVVPVLTSLLLGSGVAVAGPAGAGSVTCSFSRTPTAAVTALSLPDPVRAGSKVSATVTITRSSGTGAVEVALVAASWTRTDVCVHVPAGKSSASVDVAVSPVTVPGQYAMVGAYVRPDAADMRSDSSLIVLR